MTWNDSVVGAPRGRAEKEVTVTVFVGTKLRVVAELDAISGLPGALLDASPCYELALFAPDETETRLAFEPYRSAHAFAATFDVSAPGPWWCVVYLSGSNIEVWRGFFFALSTASKSVRDPPQALQRPGFPAVTVEVATEGLGNSAAIQLAAPGAHSELPAATPPPHLIANSFGPGSLDGDSLAPLPRLERIVKVSGGRVLPLVYREDSDYPPTLVVDSPGVPLLAILHNGQSLCAGGGARMLRPGARAVTTEPPHPSRALMFDTGTLTPPFIRVRESEYADLVPAREDPDAGESQGSSMLRWLLRTAADETFVYRSVGVGGQRIDQLNRGSLPFENLLNAATAAARLGIVYGRPGARVIASPWTQGEADRKARRSRSDYRDMLISYAGDVNAIIGSMLDQKETVWVTVDQLAGAADGTPPSDVALAQLDAAEAEGNNVLLACPKYMLRPPFGLIGNVHLSPLGYALIGEYHAKAIAHSWRPSNCGPTKKADGKPLTWLGPDRKGLRRVGRDVFLPLLGAVGQLVIDADALPPAPNFGFGHPAGISLVDVAGGILRIQLRSNDVGRLTYALEPMPNMPANGRPGCWGNVRDCDKSESFAVPGMQLHNWLAAFDVPAI